MEDLFHFSSLTDLNKWSPKCIFNYEQAVVMEVFFVKLVDYEWKDNGFEFMY